ncbi:MAG: dethiobiotin synthase [Chitinophagales bacterium]|nr:dethiobiotin synthase [Chitinophagales bacterium]
MKQYFVTGIGTDVGKTVVSAVFVEALKADYWKPIQSGDIDNSDTLKVRNLISNPSTVFHKSSYEFTTPASPHLSAKIDKQYIDNQKFILPNVNKNFIVEGAGGIMVPLNDNFLILDLIKHLNLEVILVIKNYLGSINHSLLSINALKQNGIKIKGVVFCGEENKSSEDYILNYTKVKCLGYIPTIKLNKEEILKQAEKFKYLNND